MCNFFKERERKKKKKGRPTLDASLGLTTSFSMCLADIYMCVCVFLFIITFVQFCLLPERPREKKKKEFASKARLCCAPVVEKTVAGREGKRVAHT